MSEVVPFDLVTFRRITFAQGDMDKRLSRMRAQPLLWFIGGTLKTLINYRIFAGVSFKGVGKK